MFADLVEYLVGGGAAGGVLGLGRHGEAVDERLRMELPQVGEHLVDDKNNIVVIYKI